MLRRRLISVGFILIMYGCAGARQWIGPPVQTRSTSYVDPTIVQTGQNPTDWLRFRNDALADAYDDQLAVDPDAKIWFTELATESVGFISMHHQQASIIVAPPNGFAGPSGITMGPNRKIWFADAMGAVGELSSLDARALVIRFPTAGYHPRRIVAGPDGNLWVTLQSTDRMHSAIGKVSTTGVLTTYTVPTITDVVGIAAGPDGNIWFIELVGKIGKIVPSSGAITEYIIDPSFHPYSIAANRSFLYVINGLDNRLGTMTTGGIFSERSDPALGIARDIGIGPDGHAWIAGQNPNSSQWIVARVGPSAFENHQAPWAGESGFLPPGGLVGGADGNVWFVAEGAVSSRDGASLLPPQPLGYVVAFVRLVMTVTPSSLHFAVPGQTQDISVSETNFYGQWTAKSQNNSVATVARRNLTNTFSVTSVGPGITFVTVADSAHNYFDVQVIVQSRGDARPQAIPEPRGQH